MATGKGSFFALDPNAASATPTNISAYIRRIGANNDTEEVDATVITSTKREREATFENDELAITMKWSPAAVTFLAGVKADPIGLNYEYGPNGNATGKVKITGLCNVLKAQTIPASDPGSLTELELVLNITSETQGTFV